MGSSTAPTPGTARARVARQAVASWPGAQSFPGMHGAALSLAPRAPRRAAGRALAHLSFFLLLHRLRPTTCRRLSLSSRRRTEAMYALSRLASLRRGTGVQSADLASPKHPLGLRRIGVHRLPSVDSPSTRRGWRAQDQRTALVIASRESTRYCFLRFALPQSTFANTLCPPVDASLRTPRVCCEPSCDCPQLCC